jgi:NitT/TauT family transport system substrate-binding protein
MKKMRMLCGAAAVMLATGINAAAAQPVTVRVGSTNSFPDVAIFIADKKGYFQQEGITVTMVNFTSAANMVAPLGAGHLDVGGGSPSAGLYNAVARGIKLKIVADKASSQPGYAVNKVLVLKSHVDSGRYKTLKDLKGMKVALTGPGVSNQVTLNDALKKGGLKFTDVETVDLTFPNHVSALQNKAVDAAVTTEPSATIALQNGSAVVAIGDDEVHPGHQTSTLLYSEEFATKQADAGKRFMRAYLRGVRFYLDALKDGKIAGPNAAEVIDILVAATPIKDPAVFRAITPSGFDPNGRVNVASLKHDLEFYREHNLVKGDVSVDEVLDYSFIDAAIKDLGPYKPGASVAR